MLVRNLVGPFHAHTYTGLSREGWSIQAFQLSLSFSFAEVFSKKALLFSTETACSRSQLQNGGELETQLLIFPSPAPLPPASNPRVSCR